MSTELEKRGTFGRLGFVLAASGSAIGLGNIWKFPYIAYENDGGSFVLIYLIAIALIGAPIMLAEIVLGRRTQQSPVGAFLDLVEGEAKGVAGGKLWSLVGWLGIASGFVILSYYAVIAGWTVYYVGRCFVWVTQGFGEAEAASLGSDFGAFLANPGLQITFHALFMVITVAVVILGVKAGIERTTSFLMPVLLGILLLLLINSVRTPGFGEAMAFLFHIGPISSDGILEAVGHAFFTLSLGMGAMITYGSYVSRKDSIPKAGLTICVLDTVIALMASTIMFSIIFSVDAAERAETFARSAVILFTTLPKMFFDLPGGGLLSPIFYLLVAMAALTSTISLLEVVVAYFIDRRGWSRRKSALVVGGLIFLCGIPSALSLGSVAFLGEMSLRGQVGFFTILDYLASNWMLPLGGLGIAVFTGWMLPTKLSRDELETGHGVVKLYGLWLFLLRFVCPLAILWIMYAVIFQARSFA
ncbi:MAG: sodium-dependent transporter [Acidobacteriota bacterium]|nr:sodium-dependent transporter [Acidobacteriota bacterium]